MHRLLPICAVMLVTSMSVPADAADAPADVSSLIEPIVAKRKVPGMAAAVVYRGEVVALGAAGVRRTGGAEQITVNDRFHIGSDTKAMTAMLCAVLVEEGKLKWTTSMAEAFPELKGKMHADFRDVTLEQLLTNRGGMPGELQRDGLWGRLWAYKGAPTGARKLLLEGVVVHPPEASPGSKYIYSNAGFSIAGHMAERATKKSWEQLMRERIFRPLGMATAGFGAPGAKGKVDQPRGHRNDGTPVEPGPGADNPAAIGPAGIVHCSVPDWAKFAAAHLPSAPVKLVKAETLAKLHTPALGAPAYAMGWLVADDQPWAGGPALAHDGSNTMWYATAWAAPHKDFAVLVACNQASQKACNDVVVALIDRHFKKQSD